MAANVLHKASDLPPDIRQAVGRLLGRPLEAEEHISLMAYRPHKTPTGQERLKLVRRLKGRIDKTAAQLANAPEAELDALIDEAVDHIRHRRPLELCWTPVFWLERTPNRGDLRAWSST